MTERFGSEEQKMTVRLIHQLAAIAKMPAVGVYVVSGNTSKPIRIWPKPDLRGDRRSLSISLRLDVEAAIAKGGTFADLWATARPKRSSSQDWGMEPLQVDTIEDVLAY
ncbi:MAG TPA: hypothetical protein VK281_20055 [Xanthobacteraceae bacterium]|nr:hypothetical protein [Xanthobacteraceae bacterium]